MATRFIASTDAGTEKSGCSRRSLGISWVAFADGYLHLSIPARNPIIVLFTR
jgi:hypothetical protein